VNSVETTLGQVVWELRDAAILVDAATGCILGWNACAESLFGYSATEAALRSIDGVIDCTSGLRGGRFEMLGRRRDGEELSIELSVSPMGGDGGAEQYLLLIVRGANTRSRFDEQRPNVSALGAEVGRAITSGASMQTVLDRIASSVTVHLRVAVARIWALNELETVLDLQASAGLPSRETDRHNRIPVGEFNIGRIARERRAQFTNDPLSEADVFDREWLERENIAAFAGFPLVVENHVAGVLGVFSRQHIDSKTLKVCHVYSTV
jgi:hypothetical protein